MEEKALMKVLVSQKNGWIGWIGIFLKEERQKRSGRWCKDIKTLKKEKNKEKYIGWPSTFPLMKRQDHL